MKRILILVVGVPVLFIVVIWTVSLFAISQAAETAVVSHYEIQNQAPSVHDRVMDLRQTPPETSEDRRGSAVAWLMVFLAAAVFTVLFLMKGEAFLKQWRLFRKKTKQRPFPGQVPQFQNQQQLLQWLQSQQISDHVDSPSNVPRVSRFPQQYLPGGENEQQNY